MTDAAYTAPGADWDLAARRLLAKMLGEFAYEGIVAPEPEAEPGSGPRPAPAPGDTAPRPYRLSVADDVTYRFTARRGPYGHWRVDPASLTPDGDPLRFLVRAHDGLLRLAGDTTGHLIRELTATLAADVRLARGAPSAARLADLDYAELEGHQSGHPWLVANKGRVGFSAADAAAYAPEARIPRRLP